MGDPPLPSVVLPERLDRPLRLGPFPSARAALKFVTYCAVGALFVPLAGGFAWLPFAIVGFLVSVHRTGEKSPDARAFDLLRYQLRRGGVFSADTGGSEGRMRGSLIRLPSGRYVAIVEMRGTPLAHLPPSDMEQRFAQYRDFLKGLDEGCAFLATVSPLSAIAFQPSRRKGPEVPLTEALGGYDELVRFLCRQRYVRRILFAFWSVDASPESVSRLEGRVARALEQFQLLGVAPARLRATALREAALRFGWPTQEVP